MPHLIKAGALALALALGGAGEVLPAVPATAAAPAALTVNIDNFSFGPATLTVPVGASVTWVNRDDIPHNIVANDKSFRSKVLDTGEAFTMTFSKPGEFAYFCGLHPHMTGKVIVTAK